MEHVLTLTAVFVLHVSAPFSAWPGYTTRTSAENATHALGDATGSEGCGGGGRSGGI